MAKKVFRVRVANTDDSYGKDYYVMAKDCGEAEEKAMDFAKHENSISAEKEGLFDSDGSLKVKPNIKVNFWVKEVSLVTKDLIY